MTQARAIDPPAKAPGPNGPKPGPAPNAGPDAGPKPVAQAQGLPKPPKPAPPPTFVVPPPVGRARLARRHLGVVLSFLVFVAIPLAAASWYLTQRAVDQYASRVAFSIRQASSPSTPSLGGLSGLAGFAALSGPTMEDARILNDYLRGQEVVAGLDRALDLTTLWSAPASQDPIFAFRSDGTIEDLVAHWQRMVRIHFDSGSGLIAVEVRAFDPKSARAIAQAIFQAGADKINELSAIAQEDAIRFARLDLQEAEARLATARSSLTAFRNRTQIVDPAASLRGQMGLLDTLQTQLADALIRHDLLAGTTSAGDPRLARLSREIEVIETRIEGEKANLGLGAGGDTGGLADLFGEFERLEVDLGFAQEAYVLAQTALDRARAEARRQSRYLAAHVPPTLAERAEYPRRWRLLALLGGFLFMGWTLCVLTAYSLRDRA